MVILPQNIYSGMYINGDANSLQYIFKLMPKKTTKIVSRCSYLNAEDICGAISETIFLC